MRSRIVSLLFIAILLVNISWSLTFICVWRNPVFHDSDLRFFRLAWENFLSLEGSSGNGFISGIITAVFSIVAVLFIVGHLHGVAKMKDHRLEDTAIGLFVLAVGIVLVYGTQFAWEVARTAFVDHASLASQNRQLLTDDKYWKNQATNVASIVCNPPREPKLELLIDSKSVNDRTIEIGTTDTSNVPLQMVVKNVGSAEATGVSMRLYLKEGFKNPKGYDLDWEKVSSDEPDYPDEYYSTASIPAMPRTIQAGEPLSWALFTIQPQPGVSLASGVPVKVKLLYGAPKPVISNFRVKIRAVNK